MKLIKKLVLLSFLLSLLFLAGQSSSTIPTAYAAVDCNDPNITCKTGVLNSDETWTSPTVYVLTGNVTVAQDVTLTIED